MSPPNLFPNLWTQDRWNSQVFGVKESIFGVKKAKICAWIKIAKKPVEKKSSQKILIGILKQTLNIENAISNIFKKIIWRNVLCFRENCRTVFEISVMRPVFHRQKHGLTWYTNDFYKFIRNYQHVSRNKNQANLIFCQITMDFSLLYLLLIF